MGGVAAVEGCIFLLSSRWYPALSGSLQLEEREGGHKAYKLKGL